MCCIGYAVDESWPVRRCILVSAMHPFHAQSERIGASILISAALLMTVGHSQANIDQNQALNAAVKMMHQQIGLDEAKPNDKNPDGLHVQFVKVLESSDAEGHFIRYRMLVPGAPEQEEYILGLWRIGNSIRYSRDHVFTNAKGLVMSHLPRKDQANADSLDRADEIEVDIRAARGEPLRYMLATLDGKLFFPGSIVPYPIISNDGKCRLEVRLALPEAQGILVYTDGLPANSELLLLSSSEGESHTVAMKADGSGHAVSIVGPYVAGKASGTLDMMLKAPGCTLSAEVPWGHGSYHLF